MPAYWSPLELDGTNGLDLEFRTILHNKWLKRTLENLSFSFIVKLSLFLFFFYLFRWQFVTICFVILFLRNSVVIMNSIAEIAFRITQL